MAHAGAALLRHELEHYKSHRLHSIYLLIIVNLLLLMRKRKVKKRKKFPQPHRRSLSPLFWSLARHQRDHGHGASASRGVPVYAPAFAPT